MALEITLGDGGGYWRWLRSPHLKMMPPLMAYPQPSYGYGRGGDGLMVSRALVVMAVLPEVVHMVTGLQ